MSILEKKAANFTGKIKFFHYDARGYMRFSSLGIFFDMFYNRKNSNRFVS